MFGVKVRVVVLDWIKIYYGLGLICEKRWW